MSDQNTQPNRLLLRLHLTAADAARQAFANGGTLRCSKCGSTRKFTRKQAQRFLEAGWPVCCGLTMLIDKGDEHAA